MIIIIAAEKGEDLVFRAMWVREKTMYDSLVASD